MKEEQHQFLALVGRPPARLTVEQAAWVLGCQAHDVPILVATRLLKPLGNPPQNGIKFFSTAELTEMAKDRAWLLACCGRYFLASKMRAGRMTAALWIRAP